MTFIPISSDFIEKHAATYSRYLYELVCRAAEGARFAACGDWAAFPLASDDVALWEEYFSIFVRCYDSNFDLAVSPPEELASIIEDEQAFLRTQGLTSASPFVKRVHDFFEAYAPYSLFKGGSVWRLETNSRGEQERKHSRNPKQWNASEFIHGLGVLVCPYCNEARLPLRTVSKPAGRMTMNADLDHAFNKDLYPYLALSLYNLIPACDTCNRRIKEQRTLDFRKHAHPYADDVHRHMAFSVPEDYLLRSGMKQIALPDAGVEIGVRTPSSDLRAMELMRFFDVPGACKTHGYSSAVARVVNNFVHGEEYFRSILTTSGISLDEALDSACGFCMKPKEINRVAYAKLKLDVYEQCRRITKW